jgi:hypothetical protein
MPSFRRPLTLLVGVLALGLVPGLAFANGGPSPGVAIGSEGLLAAGGKTRYVTVPGRHETVLQVIRVRGGQVTRWYAIKGFFGIPRVANDGTTEGLTRNGRTLVLSSYTAPPAPGAVTQFAVFDTKPLKLERVIRLRGSYSFDALSPDGASLYVTQYLASPTAQRYRVRVVDLERGRLLPGVLTDRRLDVSVMTGRPVTRAYSRDGVWAYTLYGKDAGRPFVHALDTRGRRAFCIELPWLNSGNKIWSVRMAVTADGRTLRLHEGERRLASIDTHAFTVRAFARPAG